MAMERAQKILDEKVQKSQLESKKLEKAKQVREKSKSVEKEEEKKESNWKKHVKLTYKIINLLEIKKFEY